MRLLSRTLLLSCTLLLACKGSMAGLEVPTPGETPNPAEPEENCSATQCTPGCENTPACKPFSIVLLPGTQYYTSKQADDDNNTYYKQTQWIVDNRTSDNLQFAIHLGNITRDNTPAQWTIAHKAHERLDAAGFPYSLATGNRDYLKGSSTLSSRLDSKYPDYFGKSRFEGKSFYGGALEDGNFNNHAFFESGPYKFMVLSLEYAPRKEALCWAGNLIRQHSDRRVIVATHCYMDSSGPVRCPAPDALVEGASGADIFEELAARHTNVFMVVVGHRSGAAYIEAKGHHGNPIHQMLVDYQLEAACAANDVNLCTNSCGEASTGGANTGNGWMRKLTFNPQTNTVAAATFSVEEGEASVFPEGVPAFFCSDLTTSAPYKYYASSPSSGEHRFSFSYSLSSPVAYAYSDGGNQAFVDRNISEEETASQPRIAMEGAGNFVAVWEGNQGVFMRGFHAGGCQRFPTRAAPSGQGGPPRKQPDVASDAHGNFVVVWLEEADTQHPQPRIRMRGFNPDGSERFAEQTVSNATADQPKNPRIAMARDGRFTVVWEEKSKVGTPQVSARGFNANGSLRFDDKVVNPDTGTADMQPVVAMDKQGRSVVVYARANGLYGRGLNADGSDWLSHFPVVTTGGRRPAVGMDVSGNFVVVWEDSRAGYNNYQVYALGYTHEGAKLFAEVLVSKTNTGQNLKPSVAVSSDSAFVVAWASPDNASSHDIYAGGFKANGKEAWVTRKINKNENGQQMAPAVALSEAGFVVLLWEDAMAGPPPSIMGKGLDTSKL